MDINRAIKMKKKLIKKKILIQFNKTYSVIKNMKTKLKINNQFRGQINFKLITKKKMNNIMINNLNKQEHQRKFSLENKVLILH